MAFDLRNLDRRVVYLLVCLALSVPLAVNYSVKPARMRAAEALYQLVDGLSFKPGEIALVVMDFGPNSKAESVPQVEVIIEHLFRKGLPFAVFSQYVQAEPFLVSVPKLVAERLMRENPDLSLEYGRDWVNLGYRPGGTVMVQNFAKASDLGAFFKRDVRGNELKELPIFKNVGGLESVRLLAQFTSLVGTLDAFLQFFKTREYRPVFVHGCTSITIPQAFIYLDSGQLRGLLEGIAGAAWYSALLSKAYVDRAKDSSLVINTGLGVAQLIVILLVLLGNLEAFLLRRKG